MAVLIRDAQGRRCNSSCYCARDNKCKCKACGGTNHGVGYSQALNNSKDLAVKLSRKRDKNARRQAANIMTQEEMFEE
jgi:hypothetical protein